MTPIANVIDMFHGDNREAMPDFAAMKAAGVICIIHKITDGLNFTDPKAMTRIQAARLEGLKVGGYHFLRGGQIEQQANRFADISADSLDFAALDFERSGGTTPTPLEAYTYLETLEDLRNQVPLYYGSDLVRNLPNICDWSIFPLWLAEYGPHDNVPAPWKSSVFWQFSDTGDVTGVVGHLDTNFFDGTQDDLGAFITGLKYSGDQQEATT
jgi:GH25 family lysozyme M1 (1,4-beta-N-acetylmuramidase)